jgi:RNA recognition motif-containing protein
MEKSEKMNVILHIENLSTSISEEELKTLFTQIGVAIAVEMNQDRISEEPITHRFPTVSALTETDKAIGRFNVYSLDGRTWRVRLPMPEPQPNLLNPTFEP